MRELKFRCWNPAKKRFEDRFEISPDGCVGYTNMFETYEFQPDWILQQYTGLKDKNAVDIYEFDIVVYNRESYKIIYFDAMFNAVLVGNINDEPLPLWRVAAHGYIIGNIYQNPELC